jgi:phosphate starvation-inducible membrane PsiE
MERAKTFGRSILYDTDLVIMSLLVKQKLKLFSIVTEKNHEVYKHSYKGVSGVLDFIMLVVFIALVGIVGIIMLNEPTDDDDFE